MQNNQDSLDSELLAMEHPDHVWLNLTFYFKDGSLQLMNSTDNNDLEGVRFMHSGLKLGFQYK